MLPLGLNLHFSRVHFSTLVADAVQAAPRNRVTQASEQAQKSQNLAAAGGTWILRWFRNKGPSGNKFTYFFPFSLSIFILEENYLISTLFSQLSLFFGRRHKED